MEPDNKTFYEMMLAEAVDAYHRNIDPSKSEGYIEDVYEGQWDSKSDYIRELYDKETWTDEGLTLDEFCDRMFEEEYYFAEGHIFSRSLYM